MLTVLLIQIFRILSVYIMITNVIQVIDMQCKISTLAIILFDILFSDIEQNMKRIWFILQLDRNILPDIFSET